MPRTTATATKAASVKAAASKGAAAKKRAQAVPESVSQVDHSKGLKYPRGDAPKKPAKGPKWVVPDGAAGEVITSPTGAKLTASDKPNVWLNEMGVECDYRGIALAILRRTKASQEAAEIEVLGHAAKDPLDVLKYGAMDRTLPYPLRMEAAGKAVAYTNRKQPMAVDGGANPDNPDGPGLPINIGNLKGLDAKELSSLRALLEKAKQSGGA